jgi:integrase
MSRQNRQDASNTDLHKRFKGAYFKTSSGTAPYPGVDGLVLTIDGQPIDENKFEYHFRAARKAAKIGNFTFHDFRHCAIT